MDGGVLLILELEPTNSQKPGSDIFSTHLFTDLQTNQPKSDTVECTCDVMYTTRRNVPTTAV